VAQSKTKHVHFQKADLVFFYIIAGIKEDELKEILKIGQYAEIESAQSILLMEFGDMSCGFGIFNKEDKVFRFYCIYEMETNEDSFADLLFEKHPVLNWPFYRTVVSYYTTPFVLVPSLKYKFENIKDYILSITPGLMDQRVLQEQVLEQKLHCVYAVPQNVHHKLSRAFITGRSWHHSYIILQHLERKEGDRMHINFWADSFSVTAMKNGSLSLYQIYRYSNADDVLYHLMKICRVYGLDRKEAAISLSGFIEEKSVLYKELYDFFVHISFEEVQGDFTFSEDFVDFSPYYFSNISKLAACV